MKIIVVEPFRRPMVKHISGSLSSMQQIVGGTIQTIYPFEDPIAIVANDEGKLIGLPPNRGLRDNDGELYDVICGTFFICGLTGDSFDSLTDEQVEKFSKEYEIPEQFVKISEEIFALPLTPEEAEKWRRAYENQG